jgi:hypothetical protein
MERGYIRDEIFAECRMKIDDVDRSESALFQEFRTKKRKLQAEVEFLETT